MKNYRKLKRNNNNIVMINMIIKRVKSKLDKRFLKEANQLILNHQDLDWRF